MTPNDRELADEEIDALRIKAFQTNSENDRLAYFEAASRYFQDRHYRDMRSRALIMSELAAKTVPVDLKEAILASNEWRDGGLILPHNADRIVSAISPILATLTAQAEALRAEAERLREALLKMVLAVCGPTGFAAAVRNHSGLGYPWEALEIAEAEARAALETGDAKESE